MNMFARFYENPAMTLQDIKKTKRYGQTDGRTHTHTRTDNVKTVYPPQTKFAGGITILYWLVLYLQCLVLQKIVEFKDFSRLLSDFPVLFKEYFICKNFSRKPSKFKYFSSLCEPCETERQGKTNTVLLVFIETVLLRITICASM